VLPSCTPWFISSVNLHWGIIISRILHIKHTAFQWEIAALVNIGTELYSTKPRAKKFYFFARAELIANEFKITKKNTVI
jgi:hypothetical protein